MSFSALFAFKPNYKLWISHRIFKRWHGQLEEAIIMLGSNRWHICGW